MKELTFLKNALLMAAQAINNSKKNIRINGNSPTTAADLAANQVLKDYLLRHFPEYGWLSEETPDDLKRLRKKRVWIVDPLDGTKEYINNIPEYVISVALVEDSVPILSGILNPATRECFYAIKGKGAWLNEKPISCRRTIGKEIEILISRSESEKGYFSRNRGYFNIKPVGSIAYKLALIAAGRAHVSFSLEPRSEWDIAAGVLLIQEAQGVVHDIIQKPFIFNQKNVRVNGIIASSKNCYEILMGKTSPELPETQI